MIKNTLKFGAPIEVDGTRYKDKFDREDDQD